MGIKVRAINPGVYGLYREPGHEFEIEGEKQFSSKWMEKVGSDSEESSGPVAKAKGKAGKGKPKPEDSEESSEGKDVI